MPKIIINGFHKGRILLQRLHERIARILQYGSRDLSNYVAQGNKVPTAMGG